MADIDIFQVESVQHVLSKSFIEMYEHNCNIRHINVFRAKLDITDFYLNYTFFFFLQMAKGVSDKHDR